MVNTSGKFVLLDKLLPRLKEEGHRILIFSQFKIMLDIIEDYLHHRQYKCERIDGSITGLKRQAAIDRFQSKTSKSGEEPFIMLLSTRAGGVGINLTAADTCIIFDSDWNPQNDLQAQARCHRIGQTKEVKIYRLLTRKTYEMQMFHMSSMKMGLEQAVLQGIEGGSSKSSAAGGTFSKASFKSTNDGGADAAGVDVDDPDFWTKVVGEVKEEVNEDDVAGKKRKRSEKSYNENEYHKKLNAVFMGIGDAASSDDDGDDNGSVASEYSDSEDETLGSALSEDLKAIVKATKSHKKEERHRWGGSGPKEWKNSDADHVLKALNSFGYGNISWEKFQSHLTPHLSKPMQVEEIKRLSWALALVCLQEAAEDDALEKKRKAEALTKENQSAGGVLGQAAGVAEGQNEKEGNAQGDEMPNKSDDKDLPQESFEAFLSESESWITKVLADAVAYSKVATSRDKDWVQSVIDGTSAEFNENLWPALRTRGWKEESDKSGKKVYTYKGNTVKSISAVLDATPRFHLNSPRWLVLLSRPFMRPSHQVKTSSSFIYGH
ncbi:chromodomain-helicase-DNA-binding protein [Skeletonema marinoi]|uniref:Chromodomain-helicase-DNA-binding protein n=1 Tax=Skeletonema marinoi TaxID=267567 RepID=A0AAD8YJ03_9STRA|nr:chromodomain-helicase-DNA-binding protein [Skeletonema marinoi]